MNKVKSGLNRVYFVIILTFFTHMPAYSTLLQSHSDIVIAVEKFVLQHQFKLDNIMVTLTSLNNQIRLPKCNKPLQVKMAPGTRLLGNISLSVSCLSTQSWKIHVAAHIDAEINTIVARHTISRGSVINENDLEYVIRRHSQLNHGYYDSARLLKNVEARRNIKAGQILTPNLIKARKLVLRGQHITIVVQKGGLNLRAKGKALMDGQKGQTIKVKNLSSKKLIYAQVVSEGVVKINF